MVEVEVTLKRLAENSHEDAPVVKEMKIENEEESEERCPTPPYSEEPLEVLVTEPAEPKKRGRGRPRIYPVKEKTGRPRGRPKGSVDTKKRVRRSFTSIINATERVSSNDETKENSDLEENSSIESSTEGTPSKSEDTGDLSTPRPRGRPKGSTDSKPRMPRGTAYLISSKVAGRPRGRPKGSVDAKKRHRRSLLGVEPVKMVKKVTGRGEVTARGRGRPKKVSSDNLLRRGRGRPPSNLMQVKLSNMVSRGRGRPRKKTHVGRPKKLVILDCDDRETLVAKRGRGRPHKVEKPGSDSHTRIFVDSFVLKRLKRQQKRVSYVEESEELSDFESDSDIPDTSAHKRGRGRPRKANHTEQLEWSPKRGRGRPKKVNPVGRPRNFPESDSDSGSTPIIKRGRGRPKKLNGIGQVKKFPISNSDGGGAKKSRGRPKKVKHLGRPRKFPESDSVNEEKVAFKRGRGRPRKFPRSESSSGDAPKLKRGRGRPRKIKKLILGLGRPRKYPKVDGNFNSSEVSDTDQPKRGRGRPKKVTLAVENGNHTSSSDQDGKLAIETDENISTSETLLHVPVNEECC